MLAARSADGGSSWDLATPARTTTPANPNYEGDTTLTTDPVTGRLYLAHVTLPCMRMDVSDDGGLTWNVRPPNCDETTGTQGIVDHPMHFLGAAPPPLSTLGLRVLYACIAGYEGRCERSLDDGITWVPIAPAFVGSGCAATDFATGRDWMSNPGAVAADGSIYVTRSSCGRIEVAASRDMGATWTSVIVADENPGTHLDFAPIEIATDPVGNVYVVWMDAGSLPKLATSADAGRTWSAPIALAPADVTAARFPALVVASPGHVAVAFWSTTLPGGAKATADARVNATWDEKLVLARDALAAAPVLETSQVNVDGDPIARGWDMHVALGDYQTLKLAPDGALWMAHGDSCHPDWCLPSDDTVNPGAVVDAHTNAVIDVQIGGTRLGP